MPAPAKVLELVGIFERHVDEYASPDFKEVMLREPFINPFFKSLGRDMENEQGLWIHCSYAKEAYALPLGERACRQ
jgi:hypothetical protein